MTDKHLPQPPAGEFLLFQSEDGRARVGVAFSQIRFGSLRHPWLSYMIRMFVPSTST